MSGDIIPISSARYERLASSQHAYVAELMDQAEALPDGLSKYYSLNEVQEAFLAKYCSGPGESQLQDEYPDLVPLYRDDIVDPHFTSDVTRLAAKVDGCENASRQHWYRSPENQRDPYGHTASPTELRLSRRWDKAYIQYMRERRIFHATFMQTALESSDPSQVNEVLRSTNRLSLPAKDTETGRSLPPILCTTKPTGPPLACSAL